MKYLKLFENFEDYNPYDLMVMFPDERLKLFIEEIRKPKSKQNLNLVRDLINLDTINMQDNDGNTPLRNSVFHGKTEIVQMLIDAGVDVNMRDGMGATCLHDAVYLGKPEIARMLIGAGADLNVQDKHGNVPLHWAADYGEVKIAKILIDAGARKDIPDNEGRLPYDSTTNERMKKLLKP